LNQEELDRLLAEWQKRLRLQDWDVKAKIVRARDLDSFDRSAQVSWTFNSRTALIKIMDPIDYPHNCEWPNDLEESLVHELLHLHFAGISDSLHDNDWRDGVIEQALTSIDLALVEAKRGNGHEVESEMAKVPQHLIPLSNMTVISPETSEHEAQGCI